MLMHGWLEGCVPWPEEFARRYRQAGYWAGETLFQCLQRLARSHPQRIAVVDARGAVTYRQLWRRARGIAASLEARGVCPNDRVVVQLSNRIEWFDVCFALWRLGAVPVLAQPAHRVFELLHFCKQSAAVAYVADAVVGGFDYRELATALEERCSRLREVFIAGDAGPHTPLSTLYGDGAPVHPGPRASQVALMQLSGGSTGAPKLIPRTHDDYLYSARQSAAICGWGASSVYLAVLPVAHNFPLSSPGALGALSVGGKVVLSDSPAPDVALPWLQREGVTALALVPPLVPVWLRAAARRGVDLGRLSLFQVGGAKLDERRARECYDRVGGALQQVFGMAEGLVNYTRPQDSLESLLTTQGQPLSEADELRIVDERDVEVAPGKVGHLLTRGPYTIRGYYRADRHNREAFTTDGFYRTGDRVRLTSGGQLVVEGRAKDQVNRGGEKIAAQEVEAQLRETGLVEDAALLGEADPFLGERSVACVVTRDAELNSRILREALRQRGMAEYKLPDRFVFLDWLPHTAVGKVDKVTLRHQLGLHEALPMEARQVET